MPPPPPFQQRKPTRPRPLQHRTISRHTHAEIAALDHCLVGLLTPQVTRSIHSRWIPAAASSTASSAGAGDEEFVASPLTLSPAPSPTPSRMASAAPSLTPSRSASAAPSPTPSRSATAAPPPMPPRSATAATAAPSTAAPPLTPFHSASAAPSLTPSRSASAAPSPTPSRSATAAPPTCQPRHPPAPRPRTPRYPAPAPQPPIAVGRFLSPPRGIMRPWAAVATAAATVAPPSMPTLSPTSPMETGASPPTPSPSYATVTSTAATTSGTATAPASTSAAATAATTTTAAPAANSTAAPARKPSNRYPPLIVEVLPDWPVHFRELKRLLGHTPNGRPFGKGVRFIPKTDQEFRTIQRYLSQLESTSGISWFCYSLPAERSLKVAIRGLPANTDPALVAQDLTELGYTPEHVRAIPARPGRPGCLMFAQLQRTADTIPGIYAISELLCMPGVTIEAWRGRKGPAQCHRCQQFRHSSHNCHRPIACVRCGESHLARDCPRPREEPATCANCGGAHTANNAACPAFRKEVRNRRAGTVARTSTGTRHTSTAAPAAHEAEEDAPASLMAAANQPQQQHGRKRRRKRGKRSAAAPQPDTTHATSKPTVVAASDKRTKAKRVVQPQPTPQPARGPLDPRITAIVGTLNKVLMAIQEQRDPIPLILGCISELCCMYG